MALSDYERKMLEELEAQLSDEDPTFAESLKREEGTTSTHRFSVRHVAVGSLIAIAGIAILVAGVHYGLAVVGVLGAIVMFGGFWFVSAGHTTVEVERPREPRRSRPGLSDFMARQNEEWERRRRGGQ